jgi:hypothetical protein
MEVSDYLHAPICFNLEDKTTGTHRTEGWLGLDMMKRKILPLPGIFAVSVHFRLIALMMEAVSTPETTINFYETTRRNIPEGCHLHIRRRENLKSDWGHFIQDRFQW